RKVFVKRKVYMKRGVAARLECRWCLHNRDMSAKPPAELRQTVSRQAGVVTRKQAIEATMSARAIEWKVQANEWQRVHTGVYATFTGELPRLAQLWAAVLYAGDGAVLSYQSAGELQGLVEK